eukprot:GFUD01041919.1.p1 GENE.GFUD01041919.1~~GFUD01041919.1.p1  ORF type:complete len:439 (-),score=135.50 GFUD01041919.1:208-1524(-)
MNLHLQQPDSGLQDSLMSMGYMSPPSPHQPISPPHPTSPTDPNHTDPNTSQTTPGKSTQTSCSSSYSLPLGQTILGSTTSSPLPPSLYSSQSPLPPPLTPTQSPHPLSPPMKHLDSSVNSSSSSSYSNTTVIDSSHFLLPPSRAKVLSSLIQFSLPSVLHSLPHCSDPADVPAKPVETLGRPVPLHHPGQVDDWPGHCSVSSARARAVQEVFGGGRVTVGSLAQHHRVRVQSVGRPPGRREVEKWIKARRLIREQQGTEEQIEEKSEELGLNQTQHFKLRIRRDSDDSMGSELTCSLPSSPDRDLPSPQPSSSKTAPSGTTPSLISHSGDLNFTRILSVSPAPDLSTLQSPSPDILLESPGAAMVPSKSSLKRRRISWDLTAHSDLDTTGTSPPSPLLTPTFTPSPHSPKLHSCQQHGHYPGRTGLSWLQSAVPDTPG